MSDRDTTIAIEIALRTRYAQPEYALLFNVGNGTGSNLRGWADAIAMSLYPSRGLSITGFEIKASRGDWKRELTNPQKAENIAKYCDYWYVVAPAGVVPADELPLTWGLIEFRPSGLRTSKAAMKMEPKEIGRSFLAAVMRRSFEVDQAVIDNAVRKATAAENERWQKLLEHQRESKNHEGRRVVARLAEIRERTGIDLETWTPTDELVDAINFATKARIFSDHNSIASLINTAERVAKNLREAARPFMTEGDADGNNDGDIQHEGVQGARTLEEAGVHSGRGVDVRHPGLHREPPVDGKGQPGGGGALGEAAAAGEEGRGSVHQAQEGAIANGV